MTGFLPPLRSRIFRGYLFGVAVFGVGGFFFLLWTLVISANITPRLLHRNYDSIDAAMRMQEAWAALRHPEDFPPAPPGGYRGQFERALAFARSNITEAGERENVAAIEAIWNRFPGGGPGVDRAAVSRVNDLLEQLIELNRQGMFLAAQQAQDLKRKALIAAVTFLVVGLVLALFRADSTATNIAGPLKGIAEALRSKPKPGEKLKLPTPNSLELRILIHEIKGLWDRVSEMQKVNLEQILRQSQKLQAVLASVEDAVLVLEERGYVTHCNEKLLSLVGLSRDRVADHRWHDLPTTSANYLKLREVLHSSLTDEKTIDLGTGDGTEIYAVRRRAVTIPGELLVANVYLLRNITAERSRERLKAEFIGVLSHELKTPIQSLGTASELLVAQRSKLDENLQLLVDTIADDVGRIRAVTNDFVQVSQLTHHSLRLNLDRLDLEEQLPRWLKPFRLLAQERNVKIEYSGDGGFVPVQVDPVKFPWVFGNLMSNAVRVTPEGKSIRIALGREEGTAVLTVADEGPGIPEEIEGRIFEPYFKGATPQPDGIAGFLGIGLTVAREVTEAHGGKIRYHRGETGGATFVVTIPLAVS